MSLLALLFALDAHASAPLELTVTDPNVIAVVLECGGETKKAVVKAGKASFLELPKSGCEVHFIRRSGYIGAPGQWTCGLEGCSQQSIHHLQVDNEPGRVNVILTQATAPSAALEITCPSGYRNRVPVRENTAVFEDVPQEECILHFKGGVPARYTGMRWGTWHCALTGTTAVCTMQ